jgi:hypothetical protein
MLAEEGIPYLDYTSDELAEEITAVRPLFLRTNLLMDGKTRY